MVDVSGQGDVNGHGLDVSGHGLDVSEYHGTHVRAHGRC
jgi:hypothetical protein